MVDLEKVRQGDYILLMDEKGRKIIVKVKGEGVFHTHLGTLGLSDLMDKKFGSIVKTNLEKKFYLLKPTLLDFLKKMGRPTQIIYPKDIGYMIVTCGLSSGDKVIECGTGSGALTIFLANVVKPRGKVVTYEKRKEFAETAKVNFERVGLDKYIELRVGDLLEEEVDEGEYDAAFLDVDAPWLLVEKMYTALKPSRYLFSFSPSINQIQKTVLEMKRKGFIDIKTLECFIRHMIIEETRIRPDSRVIGFTGYITHARKIDVR